MPGSRPLMGEGCRWRLGTHLRGVVRARTWYVLRMRTTVEFDPDTAKAVERLRRQRGVGVSEAVNELIRLGMLRREAVAPFRQQTHALGIKIDVVNVAEALEVLDGSHAR